MRSRALAIVSATLVLLGPASGGVHGVPAEHRQHALSIALLDSDPQAESPTIRQTRHDLSLEGLSPCPYCHLVGGNGRKVKPQWDRRRDRVAYTLYGDASVPPAAIWRPQGVTLVCLSCHDGTIAPDWTGESDHPVSVKIGPAGPRTFNVAAGGRIGSLPLFGDRKDQIECASCHNPHDETYGAFLRTATAGSELCRACHNK